MPDNTYNMYACADDKHVDCGRVTVVGRSNIDGGNHDDCVHAGSTSASAHKCDGKKCGGRNVRGNGADMDQVDEDCDDGADDHVDGGDGYEYCDAGFGIMAIKMALAISIQNTALRDVHKLLRAHSCKHMAHALRKRAIRGHVFSLHACASCARILVYR